MLTTRTKVTLALVTALNLACAATSVGSIVYVERTATRMKQDFETAAKEIGRIGGVVLENVSRIENRMNFGRGTR